MYLLYYQEYLSLVSLSIVLCSNRQMVLTVLFLDFHEDFVSKHMEENKEYTRIIMFLKKLYTSISGDTLDNEEKGFIYWNSFNR